MAVDLAALQNLVKRDPLGYKTEFLQQHKRFLAQLEIFQLKPSKEHDEFAALIKFLSAVAPTFTEELVDYPSQLSGLLEQNSTILTPELRMVIVRALILLRNRNLLSPTSLLSLFFKLFSVPDKALRTLLRTHIISDITRSNKKKVNKTLNTTLQNFMYTVLLQDTSRAPGDTSTGKKKETAHSRFTGQREALLVMIQLFRKNIWKDKKTVQVISQGIHSEDSKMKWITINFFLKNPKNASADENEEEEKKKQKKLPTKKQLQHQFNSNISKKTRAKKRLFEKKVNELEKKRKQQMEEEADETNLYNGEAIDLMPDPQGYAEKVFGILKKSNHSFEIRVGLMNLISRFIAHSKLIIPSFYSYMQKYAVPHQQHITQLLAILAQSIHTLIPPDNIVHPLVMHIANNFVTDRRPHPVIAIGLNTIREICARSPLVMEKNLLKDLIQYKHSKDKGVMMASRSLIGLFRAINPSLLPSKERGRGTDVTVKPKNYGEDEEAMKGIEGTEFLNDYDENFEDDDSNDYDNDNDSNDISGDDDGGDNMEDDVGADSENVQMGENDEEEESSYEWEVVSDDNEDGENVKVQSKRPKGAQQQQEDDEQGDDDGEEGDEGDEEEMEFEEMGSDEIPEFDEDDDEDEDDEDEEGEEVIPQLIPIPSGEQNNNNNQPRLEMTKILSEEEWEKLRKIQEKLAKAPNSKKRKLEVEPTVDEDTIEPVTKRSRMNYEERVAEKLANKADTTEFRKFGRRKHAQSTSNVAKKKTKNYGMARQNALKKLTRTKQQTTKIKNAHRKKQRRMKLNKKF